MAQQYEDDFVALHQNTCVFADCKSVREQEQIIQAKVKIKKAYKLRSSLQHWNMSF